MNGDHYGSLGELGANVVNDTQDWTVAVARFAEAADTGRIVLIAGPVGVGKSFAMRHISRDYETESGSKLVWVENNPAPSVKDTTYNIGSALGYDFKGTAVDIAKSLDPVLQAQSPLHVVVDEVQYMTPRALAQLRWLNERDGATWTLVLIGGPGTGKLIAKLPEVGSRVHRQVIFDRIDPDRLVKTLRKWHPAFEDVHARDLTKIDRWAQGNFRRWAKILDAGLLYSEADTPGDITGVLDLAVQSARAAESTVLP